MPPFRATASAPVRRRTFAALTLAVTFAVSACIGDATAPQHSSGTVKFSYAGYRDGNYDATGDVSIVPPTQSVYRYPWGFGETYTLNGAKVLDVNGSQLHDTVSDVIQMEVSPAATGSHSLAGNNYNQFILDYVPGKVGLGFTFTTGTMVVTDLSGGRAKGTFTGTAVSQAGDTIQISSGSFDVPVLAH